jgi:YVTN family beta-propeller protein
MPKQRRVPLICGFRVLLVLATFLLLTSSALLAFGQNYPEIIRITVGSHPSFAAVAPDSGEVYVSNSGDGTISVIDPDTDKTTTIRNVGVNPDKIVFSPDGNFAFVFDRTSDASSAGVYVISARTKQKVHFVPTGGTIGDIAITPDGSELYVAVIYRGLGKLRTSDLAFQVVDQTTCPEAIAISGSKIYVNYQCAPDPGAYGHDPIVIFENDKKVGALTSFRDGSRIANVGGAMAISPKGDLIWANGNDACSRPRTEKDPGGYDFQGCETPKPGEGIAGRGIVNIINAREGVAEFGRCFLGTLPGGVRQGAALPSFFPDGTKVAVSTFSRLLIFDSRNANQIGDAIDDLPQPGNLVFTKGRAYLPLQGADSVDVLQITPRGPNFISCGWYCQLWKTSFYQTLSAHFVLVLILWSLVSIRFARQFAQLSFLRLPLDLDVHLRKQRSRLVTIYLEQLRADARRKLAAVKIVPLPVRKKASGNDASAWTRGFDTDTWMSEFVNHMASPGPFRAFIKGRGGSGKTVLVYQAVLSLLDAANVPILLEAAQYNFSDDSRSKWVSRVFENSRVPVDSSTIESLPNVVYVIDQISEVPTAAQEAFWRMLAEQFKPAVGIIKLLGAGRTPQNPQGEATLEWEEIVEPDNLEDEDIRRLGAAYLDPRGQSIQVQALPSRIRADIMNDPTAFIVAHYSNVQRDSSRSVKDSRELFQEILDAHVRMGELFMPPKVVKRILEGLVRTNVILTTDRGLPVEQALVDQVGEIITEQKLVQNYGESNVPSASLFVGRLLVSGLVYQSGRRYLFFHDAFEDWLIEEATTAVFI